MKLRAAIRYSEYKSAGKLPHNTKFDCSTCEGTPLEKRRNCCNAYGTRFVFRIGTMEFDQCPVSVFGFDEEVMQIIDLVLTSLESGIPITGRCLLDQTPSFFEYCRIIREERNLCSNELHEIYKKDMERQSRRNRAAVGAKPTGRMPVVTRGKR